MMWKYRLTSAEIPLIESQPELEQNNSKNSRHPETWKFIQSKLLHCIKYNQTLPVRIRNMVIGKTRDMWIYGSINYLFQPVWLFMCLLNQNWPRAKSQQPVGVELDNYNTLVLWYDMVRWQTFPSISKIYWHWKGLWLLIATTKTSILQAQVWSLAHSAFNIITTVV